MAFFTQQEKRIFVFLILILSSGIFILFLKKSFPAFYDFLSLKEFDSSSIIINSKIPISTDKKFDTSKKNLYKERKKGINALKKININSANFDELVAVPHIGEKIAQEIIKMRKIKKFNNIKDLLDIKGIGEKKLLKIEKYFLFDSSF